jgi:hypothetical protein
MEILIRAKQSFETACQNAVELVDTVKIFIINNETEIKSLKQKNQMKNIDFDLLCNLLAKCRLEYDLF